jgi:transposase
LAVDATRNRTSGAHQLEPERRRLERELERLRNRNERLQRDLADSLERLAEADKQNHEKDKEIAELERKLGLRMQNSATSSKPPSSDGLAGAQRQRCSRKKKSGRRPGGQPGHKGHWRTPASADKVSEIVHVFPPECRHCEHRFEGGPEPATRGEAQRHQVTELPQIEAHITEYRCESAVCPDCGKVTPAALPAAVRSAFGPELTALIAYLTVVCRMPRRVVLEMLSRVLSVDLSLGSIQSGWEEASEAVAEPCAELERELRNQPVINSDETGYRTNGEKRWLWALVTPAFIFYKIAASRGAEVLTQLLGAVFAGILCSDRCPSYLKYHAGGAQYCRAHFKRNILGAQLLAKTTEAERFCRDALALHARLFRLWHRFGAGPEVRYGPVTREELIRKSIPLEKKFFALAERHLDSEDRDVRNLSRALFSQFERFFTFLREEGVEPTNNSAERALRPAVQWRKTSFGSRSPEGEVAVARLLTVSHTCRLRSIQPLAFLADAIRAHRKAQPVPSLFN